MMTYILWTALILFILAIILSSYEIRQRRKEVGERLLKMEQKYQDFVESYVANQVLHNNNLQINAETLTDDAFAVIQPDLRGILGLVNSTIYNSVTLDTESKYFPNLVGLTEEYFVRSQKNEGKMLLEEEEEAYFNAAREAILSDVKQRLVEVQIRR